MDYFHLRYHLCRWYRDGGRDGKIRSLGCEALTRCRLRAMDYPGSELEKIRRDHAGVLRKFIRGMRVLGVEASAGMPDPRLSLYRNRGGNGAIIGQHYWPRGS